MNFEQEKAIMTLYVDSAKTYVQLSTGVLALSITFIEKVLGGPLPIRNPRWLLLGSWIAFLIAIGGGALYQYVAVKYLDAKSDAPGAPGMLPHRLVDEPGIVYGVMVVAFYVGAVSLVAAAMQGMP
jgi:hypothetical protein